MGTAAQYVDDSEGVFVATVPECSSGCAGDCNCDAQVSVDDLITAVNIALGERAAADCSAVDSDESGAVTIDEIVHGVANALDGCASAPARRAPHIVRTLIH